MSVHDATLLRSFCAALLVLVLAPGAARGDRLGAEAQFALSEKARAKGANEEADAALRKAVEEDPTFLPARLAWGEALLARGEFPSGLAELAASSELAADPAAVAAWPAVAARARKRAQELDAVAAALRAKCDKHVADCLALAVRWKEKDPDLARSWLERALRLAPAHPEATALLAGLVPERKGTVTLLFQDPAKVFLSGRQEGWTVAPGVANLSSGAEPGRVWTEESVSGDFDLRAEVRLVSQHGTPVAITLLFIHGEGDVTGFGLSDRFVRWEEVTPTSQSVAYEKAPLDVGYEPGRWSRLEMRLRGNRAQGWIDGKRVCDVPRRNPTGAVKLGLRLRQAQVEFRKVELFRPDAK